MPIFTQSTTYRHSFCPPNHQSINTRRDGNINLSPLSDAHYSSFLGRYSAYISVCFASRVAGVWQGGSGLARTGLSPVVPGKQVRQTLKLRSSYRSRTRAPHSLSRGICSRASFTAARTLNINPPQGQCSFKSEKANGYVGRRAHVVIAQVIVYVIGPTILLTLFLIPSRICKCYACTGAQWQMLQRRLLRRVRVLACVPEDVSARTRSNRVISEPTRKLWVTRMHWCFAALLLCRAGVSTRSLTASCHTPTTTSHAAPISTCLTPWWLKVSATEHLDRIRLILAEEYVVLVLLSCTFVCRQ